MGNGCGPTVWEKRAHYLDGLGPRAGGALQASSKLANRKVVRRGKERAPRVRTPSARATAKADPVQHNRSHALNRHANCFLQRAARVVQKLQRRHKDGQIGGSICKREQVRVTQDQWQTRNQLARLRQHGRGAIQAGDMEPQSSEKAGEVPGSAAYFQNSPGIREPLELVQQQTPFSGIGSKTPPGAVPLLVTIGRAFKIPPTHPDYIGQAFDTVIVITVGPASAAPVNASLRATNKASADPVTYVLIGPTSIRS